MMQEWGKIKMKLLIHDLEEQDFHAVFPQIDQDIKVVSSNHPIHQCVGCFGCWLKTPSACVIKDEYQNMGKLISMCDQLIIISKCFYGGFSPFVKNIVDRSIPYLLPYFEIRKGQMHHKSRYDHHAEFTVHFYGENITQEEIDTAKKLIPANGLNFNTRENFVEFYPTLQEMRTISL